MGTIIFFLLFSVVAFICWLIWKALVKKDFDGKWKDAFEDSPAILIAAVIFSVLAILILLIGCITIIDSGEVGVPILFGKVQDYTLSEGLNFVNPLLSIVKYPIRLQEYTMSSAKGEGSKYGDDSIAVKTKDGLTIKLDMTIWWRIDGKKAYDIYRKIAKDYEELITKVIRPSLRTLVRDVAVKYTMNDLYTTSRQSFVSNLQAEAEKYLGSKNIVVDKVLVRKIILPAQVEEAIARKMKMMQEAEAMEFEKEKAIKQAEIKRIEAKGLADAQRIINSSLTPLYVQYKAIDVYKELVDSQNTTFVVMPTSPKGAGLPLILNAQK